MSHIKGYSRPWRLDWVPFKGWLALGVGRQVPAGCDEHVATSCSFFVWLFLLPENKQDEIWRVTWPVFARRCFLPNIEEGKKPGWARCHQQKPL